MSPEARALSQLINEPCGSMSTTPTFSFISCAATARDEARVLLPEPPFWVTNAIVRMFIGLSIVHAQAAARIEGSA